MDPLATTTIGTTRLSIGRFGLGTAPLGGWPEAIDPDVGRATIAAAWDLGIRYFDTAPFYGYGQSELWLGEVLAARDRESFVLSTKVGRLLEPRRPDDAPPLFHGTRPYEARFDFSRDGALRSLEASLDRLGLDRVDIALIHDPDDHLDEALGGAYVALEELRAQGTVQAVGAGMNNTAPLTYLIERADLDCVLVAGRYTMLDHAALDDLLPAAEARSVSVIAGGVFNSGVIADPRAGATFDYAPAPAEVVERAMRLRAVCESFAVPLKAAAIQFPAGHAAVATVLTGARSPDEIRETTALFQLDVPADLWGELSAQGLLPDGIPVPNR